MATYKLDIRKLFADLGGPTQVAYILGKMGVAVSAQTPGKWQQRGTLDSYYLVNLIAHEAMFNEPIDIGRYLLPVRDGATPLRPRARISGAASARRSRPTRGAEC